MKQLRFLLAALPLLLPVSGVAQTTPLPTGTPATAGFSPAGLERLHGILDRTVDDGSHAGYVLLLARDGKLVDVRAHGFADLPSGRAMQPDSIFRIFSMTKLVTSTAVMILVEEGKLKLSDRVDQYLPELRDPKVFAGGTADKPQTVPAASPVTILELLTHTSGYYYDFTAPPELAKPIQDAALHQAADLHSLVTRVAKLPLAGQPGTEFRYGVSTDLLGAVIEKVSGQSLDDFFGQRIFAPLGMTDTSFWLPKEKRGRIANIHSRDKDGNLVTMPELNTLDRIGPDFGVRLGGAGLFSTAADYVRFAQMLLNGGTLEGHRIISRKTVELMTQNHIAHLAQPHPFAVPEAGFGLGVRIVTDLGRSSTLGSVGSYGWDGAMTTTVQIDPRERVVAIVLYQHLPFNEGEVFQLFTNGWYSALED